MDLTRVMCLSYMRDICKIQTLVEPEIRALFEKWNPDNAESSTTDAHPQDMDKIVATANLAQAIRAFGHLDADLDPLGTKPPSDSCLSFEGHKLKQ